LGAGVGEEGEIKKEKEKKIKGYKIRRLVIWRSFLQIW
jgi:hypothetical protein